MRKRASGLGLSRSMFWERRCGRRVGGGKDRCRLKYLPIAWRLGEVSFWERVERILPRYSGFDRNRYSVGKASSLGPPAHGEVGRDL
jgi:hypothetical protein